MIFHFFKSGFLCRALCVILAFLTLSFTLSPALVQPVEAVAVADDITLALTLLFTSWAGITFASNAGAQTAVSNLLSSKPAVASSVAGLITKGLVTEGSKLLLTGDVRTAFRDALTDIQDFFQVKSDAVAAAGGGSLVGSVCVGSVYPCPYYTNFSNNPSFPMESLDPFLILSSSYPVQFRLVSTYSGGAVKRSQVFSSDSSTFSPSGMTIKFGFVSYYLSGARENRVVCVIYTSSGSYSQIGISRLPSGFESISVEIVSGENGVSFKQSQEVDGTQVTEIDWGITFVPDPSDPTEDPNSKVYSAYSIAELLRLLKLNNSDDPGLDPEKMIEELRKLLQQQQPNPDPDPEPDPDPDPDPSDPDTPGGGDGTPPDFNGMMLPGLKDFFPFCIPFDLYDMMQALCAEPEAPKFTFATSFLGQVYTVDIDLSAWNNVAATIRYMVVAIYVVALAVATRKFIKW